MSKLSGIIQNVLCYYILRKAVLVIGRQILKR